MFIKDNSEIIHFKCDDFYDNRGVFFNAFNQKDFQSQFGCEIDFVMDNFSVSKKGTLRGLHFQKENPQGKLLTVVEGGIIDVAVDIRKESKNFGKVYMTEMSSKMRSQLWVPPGFAHGFLSLEDHSIVHYKVTDYYDPKDQFVIAWNDQDLAIQWPQLDLEYIISDRDQKGFSFKELKSSLRFI